MRLNLTVAQRAAAAFVALTIVVAGAAVPASALTGEWAKAVHSQARLVFGERDPNDPVVLNLGLQIQLQEGWETYWHFPGDAGVPTAFEWNGTANVTDLYVDWPIPTRSPHGTSMSYVYRKEVVLPVHVAVSAQTIITKMRLNLSYAVCKDVCMLVEAHLELDVPPAAERDAATADLIAAYQKRVPLQKNMDDFAIERVMVGQPGAAPALEVVARAVPGFVNPEAIIEGPDGFVYGRTIPTYIGTEKQRVVLRVPVLRSEGGDTALGAVVWVTILDDTRAIELEMPVFPNDN